MFGEQADAEDFTGLEKVVEVGTGVVDAGVAVTIFIKRRKIIAEFRF